MRAPEGPGVGRALAGRALPLGDSGRLLPNDVLPTQPGGFIVHDPRITNKWVLCLEYAEISREWFSCSLEFHFNELHSTVDLEEALHG